MKEERLGQLEKAISDMAVRLHTEISSMRNENDESMMELAEVLQLDTFEKLDHISQVTQDLVRMVRDFRMMDEFENFQTHETYQRALQKLESEVRNHIKIEQQLKLYIESTQSKLEESEKARNELATSSKSIIEKLKRDNQKLAENEEKSRQSQELTSLKSLQKKDQQKISELERQNMRYEQELNRNKVALESQLRENRNMVTKFEELKRRSSKSKENNPELASSISEFYKRKYQEKCEEVTQLELKLRMMKERSVTYQRDSRRQSKSPVTSRTDRSPNTRRNESHLLATTRSSKKIVGRNTSIEKMRRIRPTSSTQPNRTAYLNC